MASLDSPPTGKITVKLGVFASEDWLNNKMMGMIGNEIIIANTTLWQIGVQVSLFGG